MIDSYVVGFLHSFDLNQWLLIDKGKTYSKSNIELKWCGVGGKIKLPIRIPDPPNIDIITGRETPHEAMEREFLEETGYVILAKRWNCFHIKSYKNCKIYCFTCAASPDELLKTIYANKPLPEGAVAIHDYPGICFAPEQYTFDLRYLIPMIILENLKGMISQLDPEGVNSEFKRST